MIRDIKRDAERIVTSLNEITSAYDPDERIMLLGYIERLINVTLNYDVYKAVDDAKERQKIVEN